jgi:predicted transcriptional regulator
MMKMAELADNKLSILFFVKSLNIPLTNEQITEFFIKKYLMNYFDLQQLLSELVESQHLSYMEGRQSHYYTITEKGKEALEFFRSRIDYHTREMITTYADQNRNRIRNESQLTADYSRLDNNEYEVLLRVTEGEITLMELKLNVINANHAKTICSNWRAKAPAVYKKIMESLI